MSSTAVARAPVRPFGSFKGPGVVLASIAASLAAFTLVVYLTVIGRQDTGWGSRVVWIAACILAAGMAAGLAGRSATRPRTG